MTSVESDRLLYDGRWLELPEQRPLEDGYWVYSQARRPAVNGHLLRASDYSCDWHLNGNKLFLCSVQYAGGGLDLTELITRGAPVPLFAEWFSDRIDAWEDVETPSKALHRHMRSFSFEAGVLTALRHFKNS